MRQPGTGKPKFAMTATLADTLKRALYPIQGWVVRSPSIGLLDLTHSFSRKDPLSLGASGSSFDDNETSGWKPLAAYLAKIIVEYCGFNLISLIGLLSGIRMNNDFNSDGILCWASDPYEPPLTAL